MKSKKRNKVKIIFYLDPIDKNLVNDQCEMLQINPSMFYRTAVLEKLDKPIISKPVQNLQTKIYISHLMMIGSNMNQIARKLNKGYKFLIADQSTVLKDLEWIKSHILEIKSKL
ncbi:hypothetical protein SAMN05192588_0695 [Nonlabens sp. Hel1_33_55]|uniref:hypothetical protein n=1 Tax=Nonlabens sp. Hel1_33_55 TaxID=1336802 RepID=UPI000875CBD5|nr:hypothetical protein [Nonlabens sp. Hel1_33_55]SCY00619.1 hypothetical protein SAMN05192588_0695 [Nonlabens sp. Hel1_33_55]